MKTKICKGRKHGCGRILPLDNFGISRTGKPKAICRECENTVKAIKRHTYGLYAKTWHNKTKSRGINYAEFCRGCEIYELRRNTWDGDYCYNTGCLKREDLR